MTVLGIDTSGILGGVALVQGGTLVGEVRCDARRATSERILLQVDRLLGDLGATPGEIARIGVAIGPGSFTGLRVGLATAKGLAIGLGAPVVAVSSLEARIFALGLEARSVLIVTAHRRGEVFSGAGWRDREGFHWLLPEASRPVDQAAAWWDEAWQAARRLERLPLWCVGDGIEPLQPWLTAAGFRVPQGELEVLPEMGAGAVPGAVARLAAEMEESRLVTGPALDALSPVYLRGTVARRPTTRATAPGRRHGDGVR